MEMNGGQKSQCGEGGTGEEGASDTSPAMTVLRKRLISLNKSHNQVDNHGLALQQAITHLKNSSKLKFLVKDPVIGKLIERTADFRVSSSNMMDCSSRFVTLLVNREAEFEEVEKKKCELEGQVDKLTKQQISLEQTVDKTKRDLAEMSEFMTRFLSSSSQVSSYLPEIYREIASDTEDDDFHDASDEILNAQTEGSRNDDDARLPNGSVKSGILAGNKSQIELADGISKPVTDKKRRTRIPEKPHDSANLWEIMKNCIGRDLSRIPMPVNFNEPLSFLQRLTEGLEYSDLLTQAARAVSVEEALSYLAALAVSTYSTTSDRTSKPFNPLLGETFEYDRRSDLGWRSITEQVSHHPPVSAIHVEHELWTYFFDLSMKTKFRGKYLQVFPQGKSHFIVKRTGHHFTWNKLSTTVQNIIVGKLWVDLSGEIALEEHTTGATARVRFSPFSFFSRRTHRDIDGRITSPDGRVKYEIRGNWNISLSCAEVMADGVANGGVNAHGEVSSDTTPSLAEYQVRWLKNPPMKGSEKMYNFTELSCSLNEPEEGVAPTDSRHRPDQRLMENQDFPGANAMKLRVEQAQRDRRAQRHAAGMVHTPLWFAKRKCDLVGDEVWSYTGEYWGCKERQDWSRCPMLFLQDESSGGE